MEQLDALHVRKTMTEYHDPEFCIEVWGDYACFTRPEMKVERVSYDVITPSAARGIFEAIFWKPAIRWQLTKIEVLKPVRWISVRRNEVGSVMSDRSDGLFIEEQRQQRAGLLLRNVAYRLHAKMVFIPVGKRAKVVNPTPEFLENDSVGGGQDIRDFKNENPRKYHEMFKRRAKKGQCFHRPYLGCREFACDFRLVEGGDSEVSDWESFSEDEKATLGFGSQRDLGFMLYDLDFSDWQDSSIPEKKKEVRPAFFRPQLKDGVIDVPDWESEEVRK